MDNKTLLEATETLRARAFFDFESKARIANDANTVVMFLDNQIMELKKNIKKQEEVIVDEKAEAIDVNPEWLERQEREEREEKQSLNIKKGSILR